MENEVLNVAGAAKLLLCNQKTIREKVLAKEIPGTKILGQWRFIKIDLINWLRQSANGQSVVATNKLEASCLSINVAKRGGCASSTTARKYADLLAPKTKQQRKNGTTS